VRMPPPHRALQVVQGDSVYRKPTLQGPVLQGWVVAGFSRCAHRLPLFTRNPREDMQKTVRAWVPTPHVSLRLKNTVT
jgi:hypothetical protein